MGFEKFSIPVSYSIEKEFSNEDTRFLNVTIDVLHTGLNFNESIFEKDVVNSCLDSIKNTAVLGFIKYSKTEEDDFKGHEHLLIRTENGVEEKYLGHAYGVIPESCNPRWVNKICSDGEEREFLQVNAVLWTKFEDCINIMERDGEKGQSMELEISSVEGFEDEDGIFHFTSFRFDGCCILGDNVEPAMIDAKIQKVQFAMNDFVKNIQCELNDKYMDFVNLTKKENKGGNEAMSKNNFALSVNQQFSELSKIISEHETFNNRWGDTIVRYGLVDIQDDEVIVVDRKNNYEYYGFSFAFDGDNATVDFKSIVRKKLSYVNFESGADETFDGAFDFGKEIKDIEDKAFSKIELSNEEAASAKEEKETVETNYAQLKADYDEIKPKYDEYVKADEICKANELNAQKEAQFAKFEASLGDVSEFLDIKSKKDEMSVEEIENKCSVLFARKNLASKSVKSNKNDILSIGVADDDDTEGYEMTKYGNIPKGRIENTYKYGGR